MEETKGIHYAQGSQRPQGFHNVQCGGVSGWSEELRILNLHGLRVLHGIYTCYLELGTSCLLPALVTFSMFRSRGVLKAGKERLWVGPGNHLIPDVALSRDRRNSFTLLLSISVAPVSTRVGIGA